MMCDLLLCDEEKNQPAIKMYGPGELEIEANNLLRKMVGAKPYKPQTKADRIRSMTDEELAEMFGEYGKRNDCCPDFGNCDCRATCEECWLSWLKSPVDKEGE
jgi:hypothetical protein